MEKYNDIYIRDDENKGAVLNTDNSALKAYRLQKEKNKRIDKLEEDVSEIKNMLNLILNKLK